jgi:glycosyltransferase involved in cell wall biosynthesis
MIVETKAMRIAFFITGLTTGGAELMLYQLIAQQPSLHNSLVIGLIDQGELVARFRQLGIQVICLDLKGKYKIKNLKNLYQQLKQYKPDLISTWLPHADFMGAIYASLLNIPIIWGIHATHILSKQHSISSRLSAWLCIHFFKNLPKAIICCAQSTQQECVRIGYNAARLMFIANGFDTQCFKPNASVYQNLRQQFNLSPETLIVGHIGRFSARKNQLGFLQAAQIIAKRLMNVHFVMLGAQVDNNTRALTQAIAELQLQNVTHLLGLQSNTAQFIAGFDLFICNSTSEAFPLVIGEAMSCAVPCVANEVGDNAYLIADTGLVTNNNQPLAIAEAALTILKLPREQRAFLGQAARARITQHFSLQHSSTQYLTLFQQTINANRKVNACLNP